MPGQVSHFWSLFFRRRVRSPPYRFLYLSFFRRRVKSRTFWSLFFFRFIYFCCFLFFASKKQGPKVRLVTRRREKKTKRPKVHQKVDPHPKVRQKVPKSVPESAPERGPFQKVLSPAELFQFCLQCCVCVFAFMIACVFLAALCECFFCSCCCFCDCFCFSGCIL